MMWRNSSETSHKQNARFGFVRGFLVLASYFWFSFPTRILPTSEKAQYICLLQNLFQKRMKPCFHLTKPTKIQGGPLNYSSRHGWQADVKGWFQRCLWESNATEVKIAVQVNRTITWLGRILQQFLLAVERVLWVLQYAPPPHWWWNTSSSLLARSKNGKLSTHVVVFALFKGAHLRSSENVLKVSYFSICSLIFLDIVCSRSVPRSQNE